VNVVTSVTSITRYQPTCYWWYGLFLGWWPHHLAFGPHRCGFGSRHWVVRSLSIISKKCLIASKRYAYLNIYIYIYIYIYMLHCETCHHKYLIYGGSLVATPDCYCNMQSSWVRIGQYSQPTKDCQFLDVLPSPMVLHCRLFSWWEGRGEWKQILQSYWSTKSNEWIKKWAIGET
jgi:hypothetical protein